MMGIKATIPMTEHEDFISKLKIYKNTRTNQICWIILGQ